MLRRLKAILGETTAVREWRAQRLLRWSTSEAAAIVLARPGRFADAPIETVFLGRSGVSVPVLADFRYAMTPPLSYLPPIRLLFGLDAAGQLTAPEREAFRRALGRRALSLPYEELLGLVSGLLPRVSDQLIPEGRDDPRAAELMPSDATLAARLKSELSILRSRLARIRHAVGPVEPGSRVLEIGFTTGGYSIDAWDRLGFRVTGIDNSYDGASAPPTAHLHIAERLRARPTFVFGDMTQRTGFDDASFDLVYSVSVLEHVSDLPAAFAEMRRLLRPGGLMVHCWNPYFSANGGHPWGLLDAPWGHLRIPRDDLDQYLDELRPFEAPVARPWLWRTLDRETTLAQMQVKVVKAGFRILLWDQAPAAPDILGDLTPEVFASCQAQYPDVTLADLTTLDAMMVARRD
jgi:SAM-dependent methyltransferase